MPSLIGSLTAVLLLGIPERSAAQLTTRTTVSIAEGELVHGDAASVTATVTGDSRPAGFVRFRVDDRQLGPLVALDDGVARAATRPLTAGRHRIEAQFVPQGASAASTGATEIDVARAPTATALRVAPASPVTGELISVDAAVTSSTPPFGAPTGVVSAAVDGAPPVALPVAPDGVARGVIRLAAGTHSAVLIYEGDAHYARSAGTGTVVVGKAGTVVTLSAAPDPAFVDEEVTFTVAIASLAPSAWWPSGLLTGAVDGIPVPGSAQITGQGESADFLATFEGPGTHVATAHFTGDAHYLPADASVRVTVRERSVAPSPRTARGVALRVTPKRDRRAPYTFAVRGTVAKGAGCRGKVTVNARRNGRRVARRTANVTRACTFATTFTSARRGALSVTAAFAGADARAVTVRAG
ncbi:Ig-like domain-containing protein [Solirubrobacter pauli]|uniref:Ig-like domain-containing protein n=1 Tax=Solirubrobacter pauli TaxID=166793 RepID=UPI0014775DB0|nr:Ig-like domain-containing protein [Solirubrobacter pauli]